MRTIVYFDEVTHTAVKSLPCPVCGKKLRRQKTFRATENPWNVDADGTPRTREQIREVLRGKASEWATEQETHPKCQK